jgi:hypothetical protein
VGDAALQSGQPHPTFAAVLLHVQLACHDGEAEPWICADDQTTGCILWKQDVEAKRIKQDKYEYPEF